MWSCDHALGTPVGISTLVCFQLVTLINSQLLLALEDKSEQTP